jgi:diguanylate cyclase (GGDEF)-like protein
MNFASPVDTREQVRHAAVDAVLVDSTIVPIVLSLAFLHQDPNWVAWFLMGWLFIFIPGLYIGVVIATGRRSVRADVGLTIVTVLCGMLALTCAEAASDYQYGFYKPAYVLAVLLIAVLGDRQMRSLFVVIAALLVSWVTWHEGARGAEWFTITAIWIWVLTVSSWLVARTFADYRLRGTTRVHLRELADAVGDADHFEEIVARALPLVTTVLDTDHVALHARDGEGGRELVAAWPAAEEADAVTIEPEGSAEAAATDAAVYRDGCCWVGAGYDESGRGLILVVRHERARNEYELHVIETCEEIGAILLKATTRVAHMVGLQRENRVDELTRVANRRALFERLETEMVGPGRRSVRLSIAMIDLDGFKGYNDSHGHVAGDSVLESFARELATEVRAQDVVARYGGDEFAVLLPDTDLDGATAVMQRIWDAMGRRVPAGLPGFSVGVSQWDGDESVDRFIERADRALYRAKASCDASVVALTADAA